MITAADATTLEKVQAELIALIQKYRGMGGSVSGAHRFTDTDSCYTIYFKSKRGGE